ncbi:MAG TPA: hypothetical protein VHK26_14740 [Methyloceanibacter sp.]|jgi:hypothetical protein|nr:hypothetical protein [Methyloceanibacter sp.]
MPSVAVVWRGNCQDPRIRQRLLSYLHRLALRSDEYLRLRQPEKPRILDVMARQRGGQRARANIETIDQDVAGKILISSFVSPQPDAFVATAREAGARLIEDGQGKGPPLVEIDNARLRGLDFKLFDPRGLYPGADRMSFVFLEAPDHEFLDGRLVEVATKEDCQASGAETLCGAELYLCAPSIHLRYYLEDWTDCLFSWIKFFFIGDFLWHRWEEMEGYADYRQVFEELQSNRGSEAAEESAFDAVLATFAQHAEHWIGEVEGWAKAEQG